MKGLIKLFTVFLCVSLIFSNCIIVYAEDMGEDNIVYLTDAVYSRNKTVQGVDSTICIKINSINFTQNTFNGQFYVRNRNNYAGSDIYSQAITGTIGTQLTWHTGDNRYSYEFSFRVNWKNGNINTTATYDLELNDIDGILQGFTDDATGLEALTALTGGITFRGKPGRLKKARKMQMPFSEDLYTMCRNYSVAIYNKFDKATNNDVMELMQRDDFTCIEKAHFGDDNRENVSRVIGHRHLKNGFTQCVVVIRGTDGVEWTGNMDVLSWDTVSSGQLGDNDYVHYNFNLAKQVLINEIISYISDHRLDVDKTSLIITGHSRGGAVENLVAKDLTDNNDFEPSVTAYTFATPNVAIYDESFEAYSNIFNFCKAEDFITYIPLVNHDWNYWKYGITYIQNINTSIPIYCNEITDLMAKEKYANNIFEYYNKKFSSNNFGEDSYSLYYMMLNGLAAPMSSSMNIVLKGINVNNTLNSIGNNYKVECKSKIQFYAKIE